MIDNVTILILFIMMIFFIVIVLCAFCAKDDSSLDDGVYYDKDGNHIYYDRKLIKMQEQNRNDDN